MEVKEIINNLIELQENYKNFIDEIIFDNMNYSEKYENLKKVEIEQINTYRKNIRLIYEAIEKLDKIKEIEK